jgi:hypothetical protein
MAKTMKVLIFVLIMIGSYAEVIPVTSTMPAAKAIAEIVEKVFVARSIPFNFILIRSLHLDLVNEVAKLVETPVTILNFNDLNLIEVNQSAIALFRNVEHYYEFRDISVLTNEYHKELHFYYFIENYKTVENYELIPELPRHPLVIFLQVNFLLRSANGENFIDLVTFTTFQQPDHRVFHLVIINKFDFREEKWSTQTFFIEKFRNFNGCRLKMQYIGNQYLDPVHKLIEEKLGFSSVQDFISSNGLIIDRAIMKTSTVEQLAGRPFYLGVAHYIMAIDNVFLVPKPAPYTYLEKALLPFESEVWFWLIGFLAVGVVVIVVVSFASKSIQRFVFGLRVKAPMLNLV